METTLHRQLKSHYASDVTLQEVTVDGFRIDAVQDGRLIEIQYGSLGAIRDKVRRLLGEHDVLVVKPLAARKYLITRKRRNGPVASSRYSPSRGTFYDVFEDFVHFVGVFPHPRLTLDVILTEQEEHRLPAPKRRRRSKGYRVQDRKLRSIGGQLRLQTTDDLLDLLPAGLTQTFTTADLAQEIGIPRWLAQKMAYCLRKTGAIEAVGKCGNSLLYQIVRARRAAA